MRRTGRSLILRRGSGVLHRLTSDDGLRGGAVRNDGDIRPPWRLAASALRRSERRKGTGPANRDYLSVMLDDPSFPALIHASTTSATGSA
jgi:hypothetical protein